VRAVEGRASRQQATALAAENLDLACYAVDPGDMQTGMQQAAFPGEDISDRRLPSAVVPALLELITSRPPSGRYRADDVAVAVDRGAVDRGAVDRGAGVVVTA